MMPGAWPEAQPQAQSRARSRALPVFNQPLLLVEGRERVLVVSDLHLGLEYELLRGGISIPSQTGKMLQKLKESLAEIEPDRLLFLGDVKHNVPMTSWQERKEVPAFLKALAEVVKVDIVPGNHDVSLADLAPIGTRVHPSSGLLLDGVGYFHGHTWPDKALLGAELLVAGHIHPAVKLRDPLKHGLSRKAWVRASLSPQAVEQQYGMRQYEPRGQRDTNQSRSHAAGQQYGPCLSASEIVIVPAFNDLCGGLPLNEPCRDERGPLLTLADMAHARIYLLDGSDLGLLGCIRSGNSA